MNTHWAVNNKNPFPETGMMVSYQLCVTVIWNQAANLHLGFPSAYPVVVALRHVNQFSSLISECNIVNSHKKDTRTQINSVSTSFLQTGFPEKNSTSHCSTPHI